jgi:nicotinamidase-related amidase
MFLFYLKKVMKMVLKIAKEKTALIVIDLQKGIIAKNTEPRSSDEVLSNAIQIIDAFRRNGMQVILVRVNPSENTELKPQTDMPASKDEKELDWAELVPELGLGPEDIVITKHQWGAFYGTPLDLNLRRKNINTIVLCGISTSMGVESTARAAYELGYNQIFAEDAMASHTEEEHNSTVKNIFRRIGRVRTTSEIVKGLQSTAVKE